MSTTHPAQPQFNRETAADGSFQRQKSRFRNWVTADGSSGFAAAAGRYHLYVSLACPWAHRTVIVRALKGLEATIGMTVVDPIRDERGWAFRTGPGHTSDPINNWQFLSEGYLATDPSFAGRVTTPTLWDMDTGQVVSNESADIVRMLNSAFNQWATSPGLDLYPETLRTEIDEVNEWIYRDINNGVYRAGFATTQDAYEQAVRGVFDGLDRAEQLLSARRYLTGSTITEADWRLFVTLIRFDSVYVSHFKCSLRRIVDYPNLWGYVRDLYSQPGIADTVNMDHIKRHYYVTHDRINPTRIVPIGPDVDFAEPHNREQMNA
jgi:putative glutathione S-transferase